ncbi:MAG TPA: tripartite tricarboxylate transporter substrate-binding protein [candidate division Zixibacteria bacterium]|nr:tripartite tricarboxylate transporter substrate-binding protein [candidate division Zixibacteria bacterium]
MKRSVGAAAFAAALFFMLGGGARAQESFYKGKTIRLVVGLAAGGGYDLYSRVIARHMGRHIPGTPTMVVENMTGAGSIIAANYMYKAAKPDGLTIGHILGGLFLQQLLENPAIEFDARKFEYIGVPAQDHFLIGLSRAAGIASFESWMASRKPVKLGGVAPGGATDDIPKVLGAAIGLPVKIVTGYKGTGPIRLAFDAGEVDGVCNAWESFKSTWREQLESGTVVMILQAATRSHPELPHLPVAADFARTEEARKLIRVVTRIHGPSTRPYFLPPGTPAERVHMLRRAYMDTMRDPEFLADARKAKLDINPDDGAGLERNVREIFELPGSLVARLKEILK